MAKVEVSRGLFVGGGLALGAALLAVVFLLGREAGRGAAAPQVSPSIPTGQAPEPAPALSPPLAAPGLSNTEAANAASALASPPTEAERTAVRAYFAAMDNLAPGQLGGDPESMARELVGGLLKGDSSGFDKLIVQAQGAQNRLAGLRPPPPCAAHHRQSLVDMDESLALMGAMKRALEGSDTEASLPALGLRANALRARAEELQREEQILRQRYGMGRK